MPMIQGAQRLINLILALLKWPMALAMLVLFLPAVKATGIIVYEGLNLHLLGWFLLPLLSVIVVWMLVPRLSGSALSIFEHEATHMLFAILTCHSPQDIMVRRGVGGQFVFSGRGNWLIFIAPYFFPTSAALVVAAGGLYAMMNQTPPEAYWLILGLMTGYHIISTLDEIHVGQTDFRVAGYLFSILFLPGANVLIYGLLFAFAGYGFRGFSLYAQTLCEQISMFSKLMLS